MAGSFSQQLEELLNPLPKFTDPEDDEDEATKAKVVEVLAEDDGEDDGINLSSLRKRTDLLSDTDVRYRGKAVSRKQLLMELEANVDDDDDDDGEEEQEDDEVDDDEEEEDDDDDDDDDGEEDDDEEIPEDVDDDSPFDEENEKSRKSMVDFRKLTAGMDDLGVSEEDESDGDASGRDDDDDDDDDDDAEMDSEEHGTVATFSQQKVDEEVEKGKAVKNQLALWDQLLEGRIKIQKALMTANQLPQPGTLPEFKKRGGAELAGAIKTNHKALKALQRSLLELHEQLLYQNPETRSIVMSDDAQSDDDEEEHGLVKRKLEMAEYPGFAAKRFAAFQPYNDATLQKWHDKTRLNMGKSSKTFGAFERNILTQVEHVLMDKERLIRRTQTRRSEYRVLGKSVKPTVVADVCAEGKEEELRLKSNSHLKDLDEDIFDDDDFYHQLLRELIERKTSAADPNNQVAMGRQWLAIQKLRSKIKKKVDTKASKGRKVRFHVHSKLVNFMAPIDHSSMSDEARSELYRGLFGQSATRE